MASIEKLFESLPAQTRAQVKWGPQELNTEILRYLGGPQDEGALEDLMKALMDFHSKVGPIIRSNLIEAPHEFLEIFEGSWREDQEILSGHIDQLSCDIATWAIRVWIACMRYGLRDMASTDPDEVRRILSSPNTEKIAMQGSPLRVQALLMAVIEGVRQRMPKELVRRVINRAFDEANIMKAMFSAIGATVDPFEGETAAEHSSRLQRYVDHLREELDDNDLRALEEARLRQL